MSNTTGIATGQRPCLLLSEPF